MKRDARIGLAVILVLGLAVTLMVARALHNHANELEAQDDQDAHKAAVSERLAQQQHDSLRTNHLNPESSPEPQPASTTSSVESPEEAAQRIAVARFNTDHGVSVPNTMVAQPVTFNGRPAFVTAANTQPMRPMSLEPMNAGDNGPLSMNMMENTAPAPVQPVVQEPKVVGYLYKCTVGDSIRKISMKVYGDSKYAQKIADSNKGSNIENLKAGQPVKIPVIKGVEPKMDLAKLFAKSETPNVVVAQKTPSTSNSRPVTMSGTVHTESHDAAPVSSKTYTVKSGDTLAKIAKETSSSVKKIQDANPNLDPKKLKVGQTIKLPAA